MEKLINRIKQDHPGLVFNPDHYHCWSPEKGQISYAGEEKEHNIEGLLHELGHARLEHAGYVSDLELLKKEVEAWQEALCLAKMYSVEFDENHMQDCLDTYRDWVHKRSICPVCECTGLQENAKNYCCVNCEHSWQVTSSRFRRPYRLSYNAAKEK